MPSSLIAKARRVFLRGSNLPASWMDRRHFVILETSFGLGHNFLATWRAWQRDAVRCERLTYIVLDPTPPTQVALAKAHSSTLLPIWQRQLAGQLAKVWPVATANLHSLPLNDGAVTLLLGIGHIDKLLPQIHATVNAFFVDGSSPDDAPGWPGWHSSRLAKSCARRAALGATLTASAAPLDLAKALRSNGFVIASEQPLRAVFKPTFPHHAIQATATHGLETKSRHALVIGAGLAGAWAAHELAQRGWQVQVLDRHAAPAQGASGNPAAIFHGTVHAVDGVHARLFRAAALHAQRKMHPLIHSGQLEGQAFGALRTVQDTSTANANANAKNPLEKLQALLARQHLPSRYLQALSATEASALLGLHLDGPAWFYPGGGWVNAAQLVQVLLTQPAIQFQANAQVTRIQQQGNSWQALNALGETLAEAPVLVLANADAASSLITPLGLSPWPLQSYRGQTSSWHDEGASPHTLKLPMAGDGYAVPLRHGGLLCGASSHQDDADATVRLSDHQANFARLQHATGLRAPANTALWQGRTAWRIHTNDRLPIVGPVPLLTSTPHQTPSGSAGANHRDDHARFYARWLGLYVSTAFGGRGVTLAPLAGALLAAQISGEPLPLEQDLVDALDPARWAVRAVRRQAKDS